MILLTLPVPLHAGQADPPFVPPLYELRLPPILPVPRQREQAALMIRSLGSGLGFFSPLYPKG